MTTNRVREHFTQEPRMSDQLTNEDRSKVLGFLALVTLTLGAWLEYGHGIGLMTCGLAAGFGWFRRR